jgi:hypothetical protein
VGDTRCALVTDGFAGIDTHNMVHGRCIQHLAQSVHRATGGKLAHGPLWTAAAAPTLLDFVKAWESVYNTNSSAAAMLCPPITSQVQALQGRAGDIIWKELVEIGVEAVQDSTGPFPPMEAMQKLAERLNIEQTEEITAVELYCRLACTLHDRHGCTEEPGSDPDDTDSVDASDDDDETSTMSEEDLLSGEEETPPPAPKPPAPRTRQVKLSEARIEQLTKPLGSMLAILEPIMASYNTANEAKTEGDVHAAMPFVFTFWQYFLLGCRKLTDPSTNVSESWNNKLLPARQQMPLPSVLHFCITSACSYWEELVDTLEAMKGVPYTPPGDSTRESAQSFFAIPQQGTTEVRVCESPNGAGTVFTVDYGARTCSCRLWQMNGRPCVHVWAVVDVARIHGLNETSAFTAFLRPAPVLAALKELVQQFGPEAWEDTTRKKQAKGDIPLYLAQPTKRAKGRPKVKRFKGFLEWISSRRVNFPRKRKPTDGKAEKGPKRRRYARACTTGGALKRALNPSEGLP